MSKAQGAFAWILFFLVITPLGIIWRLKRLATEIWPGSKREESYWRTPNQGFSVNVLLHVVVYLDYLFRPDVQLRRSYQQRRGKISPYIYDQF